MEEVFFVCEIKTGIFVKSYFWKPCSFFLRKETTRRAVHFIEYKLVLPRDTIALLCTIDIFRRC